MTKSESTAKRVSRLDWLAVLSAAVAATASMAPATGSAAHLRDIQAMAPACQPWDAAVAYSGGDTVTRSGLSYKANWWTQGEDPATNSGPVGSGKPWTQIDSCGGTPPPPPPPADCDPWRADVKYLKGDLVIEGKQGYKAMKKSLNKDPATNSGPKGSGEEWLKTKACDGGTPPPPPDLPPEALSANQTGRTYAGYYPSWSDNWFDASGKTPAQVYGLSHLAQIPANYTHVMVAFANPNFSWGGIAANSWSGTGISFNGRPSDIKAAIDVLHMRNMKVILAVGGATYNDWDGLAGEGQAGSGSRITALANIMKDLGFDGLDVDYEADANVDRYANASKAMRKAADLAGGGRWLTVAGWSTGADCIAATSGMPDCAGKLSYWGGNAGRERLLAKNYPTVAASFDMVNVMSYDARFEHYDGVTAWNDYRTLFPSKTIVSIGLETSPEGWSGANLVINDADAQCEGSKNLQSQYGATLNLPYSVNRYTTSVKNSSHANRNPRDGSMLWSILKTASGSCGGAALASPGTIGKKVVQTMGGTDDPLVLTGIWK